MLRRLLRLAVVSFNVIAAACHGYLETPRSRNVIDSDYCPQCFNGPEVCGDPRGVHRREKPGRPTGTYRSGGLLRARVVITANHLGRWSLGLCPRQSRDRKCYKLLRLANGQKYVYLRGRDSVSKATFRLPRIKCNRCVLRWWYETGNSCTPPGTPRTYANPGLETCGKWMDGEKFTNCADVVIR